MLALPQWFVDCSRSCVPNKSFTAKGAKDARRTLRVRVPLRPLRNLCALCGEVRLVAQFGDDPERLLAAGDALEIVEGVAPALPVIVPGRPGAVRAEDRVLQGKQLMVGLWRLFDHDVEPGTEDLLVAQRHIERLFVDHRAAAGAGPDRRR